MIISGDPVRTNIPLACILLEFETHRTFFSLCVTVCGMSIHGVERGMLYMCNIAQHCVYCNFAIFYNIKDEVRNIWNMRYDPEIWTLA